MVTIVRGTVPAEEFDISHQALSERLRRGTGALIEDTLLVEFPESNQN